MRYALLLTALVMVLIVTGCTLPPSPQATTPTSPVMSPVVTVPAVVPTSTVRTALPVTTPALAEFTGNGDHIRKYVTTGSGMRVFTMTNSGNSNFNVVLKDNQGTTIYFLSSAVGPYSGRISKPLDPGTYYLDITANGPWTVEISPG